MIKSTYQLIVEYLEKRSYVRFADLFNALTYGGGANVKAFKRAWQDLLASGRIQEGVDNTFRINI